MATLFEIRARIDALRSQIEAAIAAAGADEDGEIDDGAITNLLSELDAACESAAEKGEAYARLIARFEDEAGSWKQDAAACMARARQAQTQADRLRERIARWAIAEGGKIKTPTHHISGRTRLVHEVIVEAPTEELPDRFTKRSPDTTALKQALLKGDAEASRLARLMSHEAASLTIRRAGKGGGDE